MPIKKDNKKRTPAKEALSLSTVPENDSKVKSPFTQGQVTLIKNTVAKGATNDELQLFLVVAKKTGLDPFTKQIHFVKRKFKQKDGSYSEVGAIQTGIDGFRAIAERSGKYAGSDDIEYDNPDETKPVWARATVHKIISGLRVPYTVTARWKEFVPATPNDFMWNKMPFHMLGKVAEALALRKAFPNDLSGIYVEEEMQSVGTVVDIEKETVKKSKKNEPAASENVEGEIVDEVPQPKNTALDNLFQTAREFGANVGQEDIFIQSSLDVDIDWETLTDRDVTNIRTRLMSKLTPRHNA